MNRFVRAFSVGVMLVGVATGLGSLAGCGSGSPTSDKMKDDKMKDDKMKMDDKMKDDKMKMKDDKMKP